MSIERISFIYLIIIKMKFKVKIITKTGLHIGSWNSNIEIWGLDQPVVKDKDWFPYIPGSSFKWKLRSLYEISLWEKELDKSNNWLKTFDGKNYDEVSMFFWKAGDVKDNLENLGPSRFIFRDLKLAENLSEDEIKKGLLGKKQLEELRKEWENIFEEKMEVMIDRFTGTAARSWPRPLERVPAWVVFEWEIVVRFFEKEEILKQWGVESEREILEKKFGKNLEKLKELIENDYLWWQGTRWSWQVEVVFKKIE